MQQLDLDDLSDIERYRLGKRTAGSPPDPAARPSPKVPKNSWLVEWHPDMAQRPYAAVGENAFPLSQAPSLCLPAAGTDPDSDPPGLIQHQQTALRPIIPRLEHRYISNPDIPKPAPTEEISSPMGWTASQETDFPSFPSAQRPFRRFPIHEAMRNTGMAYVPDLTLHQPPPPSALDLATVSTSPESLAGYKWPGANDDAWTSPAAMSLTADTSLTLNISFTQEMSWNPCTESAMETDMVMSDVNPNTTAAYPMEDLAGQATQLSGSWPGFGNKVYMVTNTNLGGLGIITTNQYSQEVCFPDQVGTMPQQQM